MRQEILSISWQNMKILKRFSEKKMTDIACEFLRDKEEFSKWLDRNRWIAKKCDEYTRAEEQGLLLRLPCKVGDMLYYQEEHFNIVVPVRLNEIVISFLGLDTYYFQYNCCSFDECGDVYEEYEFDKDDFGKTVFLTKEQAEQKLKENGE